MATMNIFLSDKMQQWVESRIKTGRYANASDYLRSFENLTVPTNAFQNSNF